MKMYNISYYSSGIHGRSRPIHYDLYQQPQGVGNLNYYPTYPPPPKEELDLSPKNKSLAEQLAKITSRILKIEADEREISRDIKQVNKSLDYFI